MIFYMTRPPAAASIIVPTYREQPNLRPFTVRLFAALRDAGIDAELIIVDDDSRDGTEETVQSLAKEYPVRLITRTEERGLSSAVLEGLRQARHDRFVVLDADLQHPPEAVPVALECLAAGGHDFVLATRYAGGSLDENWPVSRRIASRLATLLARPLTPVSDPMSGFFALPRSTFERCAPLNPIGYKIALELYVKGRCRNPGEVPIDFGTRHAGESKFSLKEQLRYAMHLVRLYRFRFPITTVLIALLLLALPAIAVSCLLGRAAP